MTKDEAEAIHTLARQLLEEDVSVERRCRLARKIIEHARAIKAACMAEPVAKPLAEYRALEEFFKGMQGRTYVFRFGESRLSGHTLWLKS